MGVLLYIVGNTAGSKSSMQRGRASQTKKRERKFCFVRQISILFPFSLCASLGFSFREKSCCTVFFGWVREGREDCLNRNYVPALSRKKGKRQSALTFFFGAIKLLLWTLLLLLPHEVVQ